MDAYPRAAGSVLYLVVCAAAPARGIGELVERTQRGGWTVCVVATPRAATWIDVADLSRRTGYPVRSDYKRPEEPDVLPRPDAVAAVPATFNTVNKWAAGINDTLALGLLNEALGLGLRVMAAPFTSLALAAHPAFTHSLAFLRSCGVSIVPMEAFGPRVPGEPYRWSVVAEAIGPPGGRPADPADR
jgi:phosphopantothenoylcysteine decarboxylase